MVDDLMFQDAEKPGFFRGLAFESILGAYGGQEGFLDQLFGDSGVANPLQGEAKKDITVLIHPNIRVQQGGVTHASTIMPN